MKKNKKSKVPRSVFIVVDIEGVSGVYDKRQCIPDSPEWWKARDLITADINAAIRGARAAGATDIIVKDMHGPGYNCYPDKLENVSRCLQGHYWKPTPLIGSVPRADCAVMIGWHAGPDQKEGFSPHIFHKRIRSLKINDAPITEVELFAAVLGEHGIPAAFLTADKITIDRVIRSLPRIKTLEIPKTPLSPGELHAIRDRIEREVRESVRDVGGLEPMRLGRHMVEMRTLEKTERWESPSGLDTFRTVLLKSVFKPYPPFLIPLALAFLRFRQRRKLARKK
ncbi:MAG: M55 family metallopeptidase [Desulfobacterales bacterium]|nr:M55 family metallopeptidase [Desulfobacterales bacterium]